MLTKDGVPILPYHETELLVWKLWNDWSIYYLVLDDVSEYREQLYSLPKHGFALFVLLWKQVSFTSSAFSFLVGLFLISIFVIQVKLVTTFVLQCLHFHFCLSQNEMYIFTYLLSKQNRVFTRSCFLKKECLLSFRDTCNELTLAKSKA